MAVPTRQEVAEYLAANGDAAINEWLTSLGVSSEDANKIVSDLNSYDTSAVI